MSMIRTALAFAAVALSLSVSTPAVAGPSSALHGDWVMTYDWYSPTLTSTSPYWEATLHSGHNLELTLLAFPMLGAYMPTSVWGDWETKKGGKKLILDPDAFTHVEAWLASDGCYDGTITYTDSYGSMSGPFEACPVP